MATPAVTFAIASFNARAFLAETVASALAQRGVAVEVIVIDDHSSDGSWELAERLAQGDSRVRALRTPVNLGPGGARNLAIDAARGDWFAVLDSDDLIHPDRSARLVAEAMRSGADMVADDLLLFDDTGRASPALFLDHSRSSTPNWITLADYFVETRMFGRRPNLGFLKPLIATPFLRMARLRYDETLRIGEDDALAIAALRRGARYRLLPEPWYFYRQHSASTSHHLSAANADRMLAAGQRLEAELAADGRAALAAFKPRQRSLRHAWAFTHLLDRLKTRDVGGAMRLIVRYPGLLPLLRIPLIARLGALKRRLRPVAVPIAPDGRAVLFISRQRLIGATNGSSAYLLAVAQAVRAAGLVPHLVQPSPLVFGRTPFYRLQPAMAVFATLRIRGALRCGNWVVARDPAVFAAAVRGVAIRLLRHAGLADLTERKAPYAIAAPLGREDRLFVAASADLSPRVVVADYMFQTEAFPYLARTQPRTAIVMHDLFHARTAQFAGGSDSVAAIDAATEIDLLGRADAVLAIQADEAAFVRDNVAATLAIVVPMPALPVARPQQGDAARLLFVGSNTAPNVLGLQWFFEAVWPSVVARCPGVRLDVAGTVAVSIVRVPPGVRLLGLVPDLSRLYAAAGVVISPLQQGSGLKIKLVEALAHGKACVVTGVTLQGVDAIVGDGVVCADTAAAFADGIVSLLSDESARLELATKALKVARDRFGADACFADFRRWLTSSR